MRVLLVEDNPAEVRLTREAFAETGVPHELHVVGDGEAATNFLHKTGSFSSVPLPDVILLDLNLPKKGGHEVLKEIKSDPGLMSIPVIVITNSSAKEDIEGVYQANGNCYLVKPPSLNDFFEMMQKVTEFWWDLARLPGNDHS